MNSKDHFLSATQGRFLEESVLTGNIYAKKAALVLDWLLSEGVEKKAFALRDVIKERNVSIGLVQRVFAQLVIAGVLTVIGQRTSKRFSLKKPQKLLTSWIEHYDIMKKCKFSSYSSGLSSKKMKLKTLVEGGFQLETALALHSAAEFHGCKNTNLDTLELYILDSRVIPFLEKALLLEPKEKGYDVLLIEPYYKSLLAPGEEGKLNASSPLLTYLDLMHFPLRGPEQAEFLALRDPLVKQIKK